MKIPILCLSLVALAFSIIVHAKKSISPKRIPTSSTLNTETKTQTLSENKT